MQDDNIIRPVEFGLSKGQKLQDKSFWVTDGEVQPLFDYLASVESEIAVGVVRHKDGGIQVFNNCTPVAAFMLLQFALDTLRPAALKTLLAPRPPESEDDDES